MPTVLISFLSLGILQLGIAYLWLRFYRAQVVAAANISI